MSTDQQFGVAWQSTQQTSELIEHRSTGAESDGSAVERSAVMAQVAQVRLVAGCNEPVADIEFLQVAQMSMSAVPFSGLEVGGQSGRSSGSDPGRELREPRHSLLHVGIEVGLGAPPEGCAEPVGAVDGDRDGLHVGDVEHGCDVFVPDGVAFRGQLERLGPVAAIHSPEAFDHGRFEQEEHLLGGDPAHLGEPLLPVAPVVNCEHGQGGVETTSGERKILSSCSHRRCEARCSFPDHLRRRFDRDDLSIERFVVPRSSAHI
jgi:hypothetical protein